MPRSSQSAETQAFLHDPVGTYKAIKGRVDVFGELAPMPEFEPAVRFLQKELKGPEIVDYCEKNPFAAEQRSKVLNGLWHVDLDFEVSPETGGSHQHKPPAAGRFPYAPTLQVIDEAVNFFDSYMRATTQGHGTHYHFDRYRYHGLALPHINGWVVMPTADGLSLVDLIMARAAPIGMTMISVQTNFFDAYFNSPSDAKIHDDNHNRRMHSETEGFFERNGITTVEQKMAAYEEFDRTIKNVILPSIAVTPDMPKEEQDIRKAMTILYFEWLHEYARAPDRQTLVKELMFAPDGPSPFEVVLQEGDSAGDIEKRRLDNMNLESGGIYTHGEGGNKIFYFMDRGQNLLTSAFNKVSHGFYDNGADNSVEIPKRADITPELFAEATLRIMKEFKISCDEVCLSRKKIVELLTNKIDGEDFGKTLEVYPGHDPGNPLNKAPKKITDTQKSDAAAQGFNLG